MCCFRLPVRQRAIWTLLILTTSVACATRATPPVPSPSLRPAVSPSPSVGPAVSPAPTTARSSAAASPTTAPPGVASPVASPSPEGSPTAGTSPPAAVTAAQAALAAQLRLPSPDQVRVVSWQQVDWPNSCLGIAAPDQVCAQVIVEGYRVILEANGARHEYRTDETGRQVSQAGSPTPG